MAHGGLACMHKLIRQIYGTLKSRTAVDAHFLENRLDFQDGICPQSPAYHPCSAIERLRELKLRKPAAFARPKPCHTWLLAVKIPIGQIRAQQDAQPQGLVVAVDKNTLTSLVWAHITAIIYFALLAFSNIPVLLAIGQMVAPAYC